jgi:nicotinamidase-related amidase
MQHDRNLEIPDTLEDACDPCRLALIVYDMQVGVLRQLDDGSKVTGRVLQVLDAARRAGVRVYFTRHMSLPRELMGISQLRTAMAWQHRDRVDDIVSPLLRGSPGFELLPELAPRNSEAIFDKLSMSAFEGTPLEFALRDCQIAAFAIVGVAMEVGIEPTVRHGADRGLRHRRLRSGQPCCRQAVTRRPRLCRRCDHDRRGHYQRPPRRGNHERPRLTASLPLHAGANVRDACSKHWPRTSGTVWSGDPGATARGGQAEAKRL